MNKFTGLTLVLFSISGVLWLFELCPGQLKLSSHEVFLDATGTENHVESEILLENSGMFPLRISSIRSSCGCVSTLLGKRVLNARSTTRLKLSASRSKTGQDSHSIVTIETSDPRNPTQTIHVVVRGNAGVLSVPEELHVANNGSGAIRLYGIDETSQSLTVSCPAPFLRLTLHDTAGSEVLLKATIETDNLSGFFRVPIKVFRSSELLWHGVASGHLSGCFATNPAIVHPSRSGPATVGLSNLCGQNEFELVNVSGLELLGLMAEPLEIDGSTKFIRFTTENGPPNTEFGILTLTVAQPDGTESEIILSVER